MQGSTGKLAGAWAALLLMAACSSSDGSPTTFSADARVKPAPPPTVSQTCGSEFTQLYTLTTEETSLSERDRAGMSQKIAEAAQKVEQGKLTDANQKLVDYGNKVVALRDAAKPKVGADAAERLLEGLNAVLSCLGLPAYGT